MRHSKPRAVFGPQWLEVHGEADGAPPVHLGRLALQLRDADLRGGGRVRGGDVKCKIKFKALQVVHIPALAAPLGALLVAGDGEPVGVGGLVQLNVLDKGLQLLLETLFPPFLFSGTSFCGQEGYPLDRLLRAIVPFRHASVPCLTQTLDDFSLLKVSRRDGALSTCSLLRKFEK